MSRRYAPDHKRLVLKILKEFKGNIDATTRYTGVPERTLRAWRREQIERALAARSRPVANSGTIIPKRQTPPA